MKEFPLLSMFNIHENLLESLLELQNYADVQAVLAKYDGEGRTQLSMLLFTHSLTTLLRTARLKKNKKTNAV